MKAWLTRRRVGAALAVLLLVGSALAAGLWLRARQAAPGATTAKAPLFVDFASTTMGLVSVDVAGSTAVLRTVDGGHHWQKVLSLPRTASVQTRFFDVHQGLLLVSTPGASDQQLYRTGDGGVHWSLLTLPSPPTAYSSGGPLSFADPMHGWHLLPGFNSRTNQDFTLYRTVDGGRTWSPLLSADIAHPVTHGLSNAGVKTGLTFRDAQNGWMGQGTDGAAVVWITHDGGQDWQEAALPAPPQGWGPSAQVNTGASMSFSASPDAVEATAVSTAGSAGVRSVTFVTSGGGTTWTPRSLPQVPAGRAGPAGQPAPGVLQPVAFVGAGKWWYPMGSTLYVTTDRGQWWQPGRKLVRRPSVRPGRCAGRVARMGSRRKAGSLPAKPRLPGRVDRPLPDADGGRRTPLDAGVGRRGSAIVQRPEGGVCEAGGVLLAADLNPAPQAGQRAFSSTTSDPCV